MPFQTWHQQTLEKVKPPSQLKMYLQVSVLGLIVFAAFYGYITFLEIPRALNKSIADTAIVLMGLSMLMSSFCYFWDFLDTKIIYRKHLGLIGYAFAVVHLLLSTRALKALVEIETWLTNSQWAALSGLLALIIFTIMAGISNKYAATQLGGKTWRAILRTGYLAVILVWLHVVFLRWNRWLSWAQDGFQTLPSSSLIVSVFMVFVILMRIALWWSLRQKQRNLANSPVDSTT